MSEEKAMQKEVSAGVAENEPVYVPRVDIRETADHFTVVADMPGVDDKSVEATVQNRATLCASRRVTRACGSSQSSCCSRGPQRGQARRSLITRSSTGSSNTDRSRMRRIVRPWIAVTASPQPEQWRAHSGSGDNTSTSQRRSPRCSCRHEDTRYPDQHPSGVIQSTSATVGPDL